MKEVKSKRYLVLANERGTRGKLVPFEFPSDSGIEASSATPNDYLAPIGVAYEHDGEVYGNGFNRNIVGLYLVNAVEESDLVGKVLTLCDAVFTDAEQRKAFKDMIKQTLYGFNRDQEEKVKQTYLALKEQ